ncbi:MAG: lmo0937 family membrane protein, partial [Candidatus Cybelea sp.]
TQERGISSETTSPLARGEYMAGLLWTVIVILFVIWLVGLLLHFGGALIHIILLVVIVLVIVNLITGRGLRV